MVQLNLSIFTPFWLLFKNFKNIIVFWDTIGCDQGLLMTKYGAGYQTLVGSVQIKFLLLCPIFLAPPPHLPHSILSFFFFFNFPPCALSLETSVEIRA